MASAIRIDEIDRKIIRELQVDGRQSLREIGRKLGIAEATVRLRLKRLQDEEILQIVAFADPTKLGAAQMALFLIGTRPDAHAGIIATLRGWTEVSYLSTTLGDADVCAQVVCADQPALWRLAQRVRRLDGVTMVRVLSEVDVHKIRFALDMPGT